LCDHLSADELAMLECAGKINFQNRIPVHDRALKRRCSPNDSRVIHQDIDSAEMIERFFNDFR
jgi:hypothetical protein